MVRSNPVPHCLAATALLALSIALVGCSGGDGPGPGDDDDGPGSDGGADRTDGGGGADGGEPPTPISTCQMACLDAADCAMTTTGAFDADNYACNDGACEWLGCHSARVAPG
jgi:hypothetical protein